MIRDCVGVIVEVDRGIVGLYNISFVSFLTTSAGRPGRYTYNLLRQVYFP